MDKVKAYKKLISITKNQIKILSEEGEDFKNQVKYREDSIEYFKSQLLKLQTIGE